MKIGKPFRRLLLTGASGGLGKVIRPLLAEWADVVRVSDIQDLGQAGPGEELVPCDLADKQAVMALVEGVDAIVHFGGISVEDTFERIVQANIVGTANLYEAAHKQGVRRIVYASSSHVVGYYKTTDAVDAHSALRPDGMYGVSKCFGEALSRYYFDRFGLETVCLRIGSSFPQPKNARMMVTYLSYGDLAELIRCSLFAPRVGHTIAFGVSDNDMRWWDNRYAGHLGFRARDSSREFAPLFPPPAPDPDPADIASQHQGGPFLLAGPIYQDG